MTNRPDLLFYGTLLSDVLRANLEKAKENVDEIPHDKFLHSSDEEIVEHIYSMRVVMPLVLHEDQREMDMQEVQVDVSRDFTRAIRDPSRPFFIPGVGVSVIVPFEGDARLWKCQPSTFTLSPPCACVKPSRDGISGFIEIVRESPADKVGEGETIKREVDKTLDDLRGYIARIQEDVEEHNKRLREHIRQCVENRRQRLGKQANIAKTLNIPLKHRPGAPEIVPLPIKRKLIRPLPAVPNAPTEPGIRDEDYDHILNVVRHEGRTFETIPQTFAKHDEEDLRNIILAHLNGHYEGDATGETFRGKGKTDIRIEFENRAAFVGECKVWRGPKEIGEALDQLLGYLTWRDCKAALVLFNKDVAGFAALQEKLPQILRSHSNFIRPTSTNEAGEWRFVFRSMDDEDRHITVHVFLFNLFVPSKSPKGTAPL